MSDREHKRLWERFIRRQGVRVDPDEVFEQHIGGDAPAVRPLDPRETSPTGATVAGHQHVRDMPMQVFDPAIGWVEYEGDAHGSASGGGGRDVYGGDYRLGAGTRNRLGLSASEQVAQDREERAAQAARGDG